MRMRLGLCALGFLLISCADRNDSAELVSAAGRAAIETATDFLNTGDTTDLRLAFNEEVLAQLSPEGMVAVRSDMIANFGELKNVSEPEYDTLSQAHIAMQFEQATIKVSLSLDADNKISFVAMTTAPLGDSTDTRTRDVAGTLVDVDSLDQLARTFEADTACVRLVCLLSPT